MKSSFRKLRHIALHKNSLKEPSLADQPEFAEDVEALRIDIQDVEYMREQYDGLLVAAQGISGSAYDFSRSIQEMASYMLETFGKIGDGETGSTFSMLGKVQYEISKLLDLYAAHVSQTIISPTDSLLKELQSIEEMKGQFEEKQHRYNHLKTQKIKGKGGKKEKGTAADKQIMAVKEEANDLAVLLDLRLQSLKLGQDLSLITMATRHHTAQLHLFGKGLDSLNAVEPVVRHLSQEHKIDRTLSEGDIGMDVNVDEVDEDGERLEVGDEEESMPSSPSTFRPVAIEASNNKKELERISKSAPISPSRYFGTSNAVSIQEFKSDRPAQKTVTTYALPSPPGVSGGLNTQSATSADKIEENEPSEVSGTGASVNAIGSAIREGIGPIGLGKPETNRQRDAWQLASTEEEVRLWTKPSSGYRHLNHNGVGIPTVSQHIDPLYKSGPIARSSVSRVFVSPRISPSISPPQLSPPHISELHKLPTPPSSTDGMKGPQLSINLGPTHTQQRPHHGVVTKSRSIPASVHFARNLQHAKDSISPVTQGISRSPPPRIMLRQESIGKPVIPTEGKLSNQI